MLKLLSLGILYTLCSNISFAQQTIEVHSKTDKRYVKYVDSLRAYNKWVSNKKKVVKCLDSAQTFGEYSSKIRKIWTWGVFEDHDLHRDSKDWEKVFRWNDYFFCCMKIVHPPKTKVVFTPIIKYEEVQNTQKKDTSYKIQYVTVKLGGKQRLDSSKKIKYNIK